jgi:hypothetical protein
VLVGQIHGDADAMDGRREAGEQNLLARGGEDVVQARNNGFFARCKAGAVHVGGVLQQAEYTLLAEVGESLQVEGMAVGRRKIDLEVSGVEHDADRGVDGKRHAVDQRVRDPDGHDVEDSKREAAAGKDLDQLGVVKQAMLFELALDIGQGELGAVDRDVQLGEDPGQAADVVFVTVGEADAADLVAVLDQIANVGNDNVDAKQLFFGKHQSGVDDDDVVVEAKGEAVHSELA